MGRNSVHGMPRVKSACDWYHNVPLNEQVHAGWQGAIAEASFVFDNFVDFHAIIRDRTCPHFVFRGSSDTNTCPFRESDAESSSPPHQAAGAEFFTPARGHYSEYFRAHAHLYSPNQSLPSDWHWLTLAQHYGLATRLLDWTENPLVALYLASRENFSEDGALYFLHVDSLITSTAGSPFDNKQHGAVLAPHITQRLAAQADCLPYTQPRGAHMGCRMMNTARFELVLQLSSRLSYVKFFRDTGYQLAHSWPIWSQLPAKLTCC